MTQEQWDRAFKLFHEALDKTPSERTAFLDSQRPDPEIRAEVESLLANASDADPILGAPAIEGVREAIQTALTARDSRREQLIEELTGTTAADRYQIVECIGKGGHALVFLAVDLRVGHRKVVVKVLDGEDENRDWLEKKFRQEIEVLAKINHSGVVGISDCGRLASGQPFLVMNFVDGINLRERLRTAISRAETAEIVRQMGSALSAAHALGVVHLDLKPENIMLARTGNTGPVTVKLIDFGIARMQHRKGDETTAATMVAGTASYMAPEQFMGVTSPASDIYAMGVICFEMLTGCRPQVLQPGHELPSGVGTRLTPAFDHEPTKRPMDAEAFGNSLSATLVGRGSGKRIALVAAAAAVVLIAAGVYFWQRAHLPSLTDKDVLVLADFTNTTGDSIFDATLRQALSIGLEQSPFLKILDDTQMHADIKTMGRDSTVRITSDIARDLCVREGLKAVVSGSIARVGQRYPLALSVTDCHSGANLAGEEIEAEDKDHVLRTLSRAATAIRERLGEPLSSIRKLDQPLLYPVTTASLEAFRAYGLGMEEIVTDYDTAKAIPLLEPAVELDPQFAMAWHLLGNAYRDGGDGERATMAFKKAYSLRAQASEREQLEISAYYESNVNQDLDKAAGILEAFTKTYPRASIAQTSLGNVESARGDYETAVQHYRQATLLDPGVKFYKMDLAGAYINAGRPIEARTILRNLSVSQDSALAGRTRALTLYISWITGDHPPETSETDWLSHNSLDDSAAGIVGSVYFATGRIRRGEKLMRPPALAAQIAELYAIAGDCERARDHALKSLSPSKRPDDAFPAGIALALCGGGNVAKLVGEVSARYPSATLWNNAYLPDIRAAQAIQSGRPAGAFDILPNSTSYEKAYPEGGYLRGLADLKVHKDSEAAAEFRKIVDGKGTYFMQEIYYPASLVGLARAEALSGDTAKAKKAYEDFFNLWKDADPDVPLLVAARKEYKQLQ